MHETAICQGIVDIICNAQKEHGFRRASRIRVEIGALSAVDPDALRTSFLPVSAGTPAEGATLEIEEPPGKAWCMDCSMAVTLSRRADPCPNCGRYHLVVQSGDEMRVMDMEVL